MLNEKEKNSQGQNVQITQVVFIFFKILHAVDKSMSILLHTGPKT